MKAFLRSLAKKITYVVCACIIFIALIVCASYFLSPIVEKHREDIEKLASDLLSTPVLINKVELSWYQYQPVINLNAVTILSKETKQPALQVQKVRLFISILQSLWNLKPVQNGILIYGSEIAVHRDKSGEINIQGFPAITKSKEPYQSEMGIKQILGLLSQQPRLILQNIDIHYTGFKEMQRFVTLHHLSILNSDGSHSIIGDAVLHQDLPTTLNLAIDWKGNPNDLASIHANVYAYVSGLSLTQWLKNVEVQAWQFKKGIGSAKVWLELKNNLIQKMQTSFQLYDLALYSLTDKKTQTINRFSGNIGWRRDGNKQVIAGDEILIDLPTHLWPMTSFNIKFLIDETGNLQPLTVKIGHLDINDVQTFLFSSKHFLPDAIYDTLPKLHMTGSIENIDVVFPQPDWQDFHKLVISADLAQFTSKAWQKYPGISNLYASVKWNVNSGKVEFKNNSPLIFQYDSIFANSLKVNQLTGKISADHDDNNNQWKFNTDDLQLQNNDLTAKVKSSLTLAGNQAPEIDLTGNFSVQEAKHIALYLPLRIFDAYLAKWLQQAFKGGEVKSGVAILKGKLTDFPFAQGNGVFSIAGDVANIEMRFAPQWPKIKKVKGKLIFSGDQMTADIDQAEILGIPINKVHAQIPSLGGTPSILQISGSDIQTDFTSGIRFIKQSPLETTIGKMFNAISVTGPATVKLGLTVPLQDTDKTEVQGDLQFQNAEMNIEPVNLKVNQLNGAVHFTENSVAASNIAGLIFDKPVHFDLKTNQKAIGVNFKTNVAANDLETWLKVPFAKVMQGATDINGKVNIAMDAPIVVRLTSDLKGMALTLPLQFGKKENETKNFAAEITLSEREPIKILLNYGANLASTLILKKQNQEYKLFAANILLGEGVPIWPTASGLYISANFDKLDWDIINEHIKQVQGKSEFSDVLPLKGINIYANNLSLGGVQLNQINLQIMKEQNNWRINVDSPDVIGKISAPLEFNNRGTIAANFQKLRINSATASRKAKMSMDLKAMPAILLDANNVSFDNMVIGDINFNAVPVPSGLNIKTFTIKSPNMFLRASGDWTINNVTRLKGEITSPNVSALLNGFGMDVHNYMLNMGRVDFDLSWNDAPFAPALAQFNGSARLELGHGRILDVGQSNNTKMDIGRVLSIFSLQNIPRRLTFDFSDLFQKGYSFDFIRGDFSFRNGDVYTQNLAINGPVISVEIDGRIGLVNKIYDLTVSITPHDVTSGIPVAATILTANPIVGLAALGVNTVLSPSLSHAVTFYYSVTGPWNNPAWRQISGR